MILVYLCLVYLFLEPFLSSVEDRLSTKISFNESVFRNLNPYFWCKEISSSRELVKNTRYRIDAWHLTKSFRVIITYFLLFSFFYFGCEIKVRFLIYICLVIACGIVRNKLFNFFFHYILNKKE